MYKQENLNLNSASLKDVLEKNIDDFLTYILLVHKPGCKFFPNYQPADCTCGLTELLVKHSGAIVEKDK